MVEKIRVAIAEKRLVRYRKRQIKQLLAFWDKNMTI